MMATAKDEMPSPVEPSKPSTPQLLTTSSAAPRRSQVSGARTVNLIDNNDMPLVEQAGCQRAGVNWLLLKRTGNRHHAQEEQGVARVDAHVGRWIVAHHQTERQEVREHVTQAEYTICVHPATDRTPLVWLVRVEREKARLHRLARAARYIAAKAEGHTQGRQPRSSPPP
jgi:hypothetical protein